MRVAERGKHTAQVRRNILHNESECHILFLARGRQNEKAERQKGEKCHIVGNEHRTDKGYVSERKHASARVLESLDDFLRQEKEETDIFKGANDGKDTEKAGERFPVEIIKVLGVWRHNKCCNSRGENGDEEHSVLFDKGQNVFVQDFADMQFCAVRVVARRVFCVHSVRFLLCSFSNGNYYNTFFIKKLLFLSRVYKIF